MAIKLRNGEKEVITANIHWSTYIPRTVLAFFGGVLLIGVFMDIGNDSAVTSLVMSGLMIFPLIKLALFNRTKIYTITSERFYVEEGILSKKRTSIPLSKINDAQMSQSMMQRSFNSGNISVLTGSNKKTILKDIDNPNEFLESIESCIGSLQK